MDRTRLENSVRNNLEKIIFSSRSEVCQMILLSVVTTLIKGVFNSLYTPLLSCKLVDVIINSTAHNLEVDSTGRRSYDHRSFCPTVYCTAQCVVKYNRRAVM
jgi:hypothetical protein